MKIFILFISATLLASCFSLPAMSQGIIANHQSINLEDIPLAWINQSKADFRIWYGHTSHGSQITTGLQNLQSHLGAPYTFNSSGSGGALSYQELDHDLGQNGDLSWYNLTRNQLDNPSNDRNVVIWSWCGGVSYNSPEDIVIYLNAMTQLELDYPNVKFVYMTGHLDIWSWANLKARNQQIRDYCIANQKILFDFADIESYDPDGAYYEYATDNCDYYQGPGWGYLGNWANEFCDENPASEFCWSCECAHSEPANCNMKGRAFWWMLANMAGWEHESHVFYVDKNNPLASNENPGTFNLPWLTIQHAADLAQAGDSIIIREGTYYESLTTQAAGNETDGYIVFAAPPGEEVVIDGSMGLATTGFYLYHPFVKLYNLQIGNWDSTGIWAQNAAFFEIHGCEVHDVIFGIGIAGNSHDFLIDQTEVHHFGLYGFDASPYLEDFCYNGKFINCIAHTGIDPLQNVDGFALGHGGQHNFLFEHCIAYDVYDGFDISAANTLLDACLSYNSWNASYKLWQNDVEMVNCIGYNSEVSIVQIASSGSPTENTLRNCTFYDAAVYTIWQADSNDILNMYNCIVAGGENIGLAFEQPSSSNYHGNHNLFQNNNPARAIVVSGEAEFSLSDLQNGNWTAFSGQDAESLIAIQADEIFSDPMEFNLHLAAQSPAIDHADPAHAPLFDFDGNFRTFGDAPDIGAFESIVAPAYSVAPHSINFGTVFTGERRNETVTITNESGFPIIIDDFQIDGLGFERDDIDFPIEINANFSFDISFVPLAQQSYVGVLTIFSEQSFNTEVALFGNGISIPVGGFHVSGEVSGVWQTYDTVFVDGDIVVPDGQYLSVSPVPGGTDFVFTGHYKFIVYGQLDLLGNAQDSIILWSVDQEEGWHGLRFYDLNYNAMDSSHINFCSFKYGNANGTDWDNSGGGLFVYESSKVVVSNCMISRNRANAGGGGIHIRYSSPQLKHLNISNNEAPAGGGIEFWGAYANISHCLIVNNTAEDGGAININGCSPLFDHSTLSGNFAASGGGIFMYDWSYPEFSNSIIWGNQGDEIFVMSGGGVVVAEYSDIGGSGTFNGQGNINADPLFADTENGLFALTWLNYPVNDQTKSPCIDSGDPDYPPDPDGTQTDIGALHFLAQNNHFQGGEISGIFNDLENIWIDGNIIVPEGETLEIHAMTGGTDITFSGPFMVTVYGRLLLLGNISDSIVLDAEDPETGWLGIRFLHTDGNEQEGSQINFCMFENCKNLLVNDGNGGAVYAEQSSNLIISHSVFLNNEAVKGGAIALLNSNPEISDLLFAGNIAEMGGGMYIEESASPPSPVPAGLLHLSDIEYCGAFRLPEGSNGSNWFYSGSASAYFPDGDPNGPPDGFPGSIFAVGHDWYFDISEISIPVPVISASKNPDELNTATTLQPFQDVTNGVFDDIAFEIIRMGLEYLPAQGMQTSGKLYMCLGQHFQFDFDYSHIWFNTNLADPQMAGPWYFGNIDNYRTNDYLFAIPEMYAENLPNRELLISGRYRDGGWGGKGPNMYAFAPWTEGNPPPALSHLQNITPLLGYTDADSLNGYKHADEWNGGAWLTFDTLSSVIVVGTKARGDCWYGFADGTLWPNDSGYIPPYPANERGWWADVFDAGMMFYNPADLLDVAAGNLQPYQPQPYEFLSIDQYLYNPVTYPGRYKLGSCCFDRANGLIYIFERMGDGDKCVVHTFRISPRAASPTIREVASVFERIELINNWADQAGGGMYLDGTSQLIQNVKLEGNGTNGFGGAVAITGNSSPELYNFLITGNLADYGGGVAFNENSGNTKLYNFTFTNNESASGGGAVFCNQSSPFIQNSIMWQNMAEGNGDEVFLNDDASDPLIGFSDIAGGPEAFAGDGASGNYNLSGYAENMDENPLFEDISWNFRLQNTSLCINSGNPNLLNDSLPETDLDGNARVSAYVVDLGVYENQEFVAPLQEIILTAGWSGISSYINPYFGNLENVFANVSDHLVILQNQEGIFWPGQQINTLGSWDYRKGYLVKMDENLSVSMPGEMISAAAITMEPGWSLFPVVSSCGLQVDELVLQTGNSVICIKEAAGVKLFWPEMDIQTLFSLEPGKAYFILTSSETTITFPACDD